MNTTWRITLATSDDQEVVTGLIEDRADWLRTHKNTTQWQTPWPDAKGRYHRIRDGLLRGRTWIVWDHSRPIATVTIYLDPSPELWTEIDRKTEAIYLHRLVVHRDYKGTGLGAELINWAVKKGTRLNRHAEVVRLDAWTDNTELHAYYLRQGFRFVGYRTTKDNSPSGALFEKPVLPALQADTSRLVEDLPCPSDDKLDGAARSLEQLDDDPLHQEQVLRQLVAHLPSGRLLRILDVGSAQVGLTLRLAREGHQVTRTELSVEMRGVLQTALEAEGPEVRRRVEILPPLSGQDVAGHFDAETFDVALCHGTLAYLPQVEGEELLKALAHVLQRQGGLLSLLTINGDALALRPGLKGDLRSAWTGLSEPGFVTREGLRLRAFSRDGLSESLRRHQIRETACYGVRAPGNELADLFTPEERAGSTDPSRGAAFVHTIGIRE